MRILRDRRLYMLTGAIVVIAVAVLVMTSDRGSSTRRPSERGLQRIVDRATDDPSLERGGIFITGGGVIGGGYFGDDRQRCAQISMLNPTRANLAYLRARFGPGLCPDPKPAGAYAQTAMACIDPNHERPGRKVVVPDLRGLEPYLADRRARAVGLVISSCSGSPIKHPGRYSYENALRVNHQCPVPGRRVSRRTGIAVTVAGRLPGGFVVTGGDYGGASQRCRR